MTQQQSEPSSIQSSSTSVLLPPAGAWPTALSPTGQVVWQGPTGGVTMTVAVTAEAVWIAVDRAGVRPGVLDALGWWLSESLAARFVPDAAQAEVVLREEAVAATGANLDAERGVGWVGPNAVTVAGTRRILCALALGIRAAGAGGTVGPWIAAWAADAQAPDPGGWLGLVPQDGLWAQGHQLAGPEGTAALWVEALTGRWLLVSPDASRGGLDAARLEARAGVPVRPAPAALAVAARAWHQQVTAQTPSPDVFLLEAALAPAEWQERVADRVLRHAVHATWVPAQAPSPTATGPQPMPTAPAPAAAPPFPSREAAGGQHGAASAPPAWEWVGPPPIAPAPPAPQPPPPYVAATQPAVAAPSAEAAPPPAPLEPAPASQPASAEQPADADEAPADAPTPEAPEPAALETPVVLGEPLPAPEDPGRFDVRMVDAGPDTARTATLLVAALGVQRSVADAWCAAVPAQIAHNIDAARVRRLDTLVRAGAAATLQILRDSPADASADAQQPSDD